METSEIDGDGNKSTPVIGLDRKLGAATEREVELYMALFFF